MAKRDREEAAEAEAQADHTSPGKRARHGQQPGDQEASNGAAAQQPPPAVEEEEEEDDMAGYLPRSTSRAAVKKGQECPYLDTISRQVSTQLQRTVTAVLCGAWQAGGLAARGPCAQPGPQAGRLAWGAMQHRACAPPGQTQLGAPLPPPAT